MNKSKTVKQKQTNSTIQLAKCINYNKQWQVCRGQSKHTKITVTAISYRNQMYNASQKHRSTTTICQKLTEDDVEDSTRKNSSRAESCNLHVWLHSQTEKTGGLVRVWSNSNQTINNRCEWKTTGLDSYAVKIKADRRGRCFNLNKRHNTPRLVSITMPHKYTI